MAYTLISMIGTGMYKTSKDFEGYKETNYSFKEKHFKTRLFMEAILQMQDKTINQIILLGTDTSSWDCLVDKDNAERDETIELWDSLFDQCEKTADSEPLGVSRENLDRLEKYLSERFKTEVIILCHTQNIDGNTLEELFDYYTSVANKVRKGNDILFDITHGFRSMPVLLYQSLQYSLSQENRKVEIIYGELDINDKSKGCARDLSKYWSYSELTSALNVFKSKLDGFKLAELIEPYWEKGSKAIKRLSEIVQTNFAFQIEEVCRQIKNALDKFPTDEAPKYLDSIKTFLKEICNLVDEEATSKTLFKYSQFLYSHNLNVQAIITLQITVEAAIVEKYASSERFGDYDWWKEEGKGRLDKQKSNHWKKIGVPLTNLEHFRNQIAHGGGKDKDGKYPHAANISSIYESGKKGVEKLLEILKSE